MPDPEFDKVVKILSQKSGRAILRSILNRSKTFKEVHQDLRGTDSSLKYRESVYKALERLVSAGLVEKIREDQSVRYRSRYSRISADFVAENLNFEERNSS